MKPRLDPECDTIPRRVYHNVYQFDVKMMYPSFVLAWRLDPMCVSDGTQPRTLYDKVPDVDEVYEWLESIRRGECRLRPIYTIISKLVKIRKRTKELKKRDPRFEHVDNAVKAILNALAYGVMAKHGWAPLGSEAVAEAIFHGTRAAQYDLFYKAAKSKLLKEKGCIPIYSDTDSIYISCSRRLNEEEIREIHEELNNFLKRWGLELDFEGEWRQMIIHSKKNYILVGDEDVVIKGGHLHQLVEFSLPEFARRRIGDVLLNRVDPGDVARLAESLPVEELAIETHNMISRMVINTEKERRTPKHVCRVRTPWYDVPYGRLLRVPATGWHHPRRLPLLVEAWRRGGGGRVELRLDEFEALQIIDARGYAAWGYTGDVAARLCRGSASVVVEDGRVYCLGFTRAQYRLRMDRELLVETIHPVCDGMPILEAVVFEGVRSIPVPEDEYRRAVRRYVAETLNAIIKAIR